MEQVSQCTVCRPEAFPMDYLTASERQGPNHYSARFGVPDVYMIPALNGKQLDRCFELLAGPDGWAVLYQVEQIDGVTTLQRCSCGSGEPCMTVVRGNITVELNPEYADVVGSR